MALIDGLISYWKLDEAAGDADDAHDANDGSVTGCTQGAAGKINTSYSFDGDADRVYVAHNANLEPDNFSVSAWVQPDNVTGVHHLIGKNWGVAGCYGFELNGNKINAFVRDAEGNPTPISASTTSLLTDGTWYHVVVTYVKSTKILKLYINSSNEDTDTGAAARGTNTNTLEMGGSTYYNAYWFDGRLDEVGIWDRVLTQAEVTELYNGGAGLAYPFAPPGTNTKINISDVFKDASEIKINIGDSWKAVNKMQINIGDAWKTVFG